MEERVKGGGDGNAKTPVPITNNANVTNNSVTNSTNNNTASVSPAKSKREKDIKSVKPMMISPRPMSQPPPPRSKDLSVNTSALVTSPSARIPNQSTVSARPSSPKRLGRSSPVKAARTFSDPTRRRATSAQRSSAVSGAVSQHNFHATESFLAKLTKDGGKLEFWQ